MELIAGESKLNFSQSESLVVMEGSMRLANLTEYEKVADFLAKCLDDTTDKLTLDFSNLNFLNSSGITTLSMFILKVKKLGKPSLFIIGSNSIAWQGKSLKNFNKLWQEVTVEFK